MQITLTDKPLYIPLLSVGLLPRRRWLAAALNQHIKLGILPLAHRQWLGWGNKRSNRRAKALAALAAHSATLQLEDGFIRSIGLPRDNYPVWSVIYDPVGIYYNACEPSYLEQLIQSSHFDQATLARASACMALICQHNISKYNHAPDLQLDAAADKKHILVVDQTKGDLSISASGASAETFQHMLQVALETHPDAVIWVKTHPEVSARHKQGHFKPDHSNQRIRYITTAANPLSLLKQMDEVYVVSSQMGFEALMLGKKVHCFGLAWYAGWGLSHDAHAALRLVQQRRTARPSLCHLFAAAYFHYSHYIDPYTGQRCTLENILEIAINQKQWNEKLAGNVLCVGFSPWKKQFIHNFLKLPSIKPSFSSRINAKNSQDKQHIIVWGMKQPELSRQHLAPARLWRMEDGFVRSVGLGAKLIAPYSLVLDDQGIYYNPQQPSRLEQILASLQLQDSQRKRIRTVMTALIEQNISKYNLHGANDWPGNIPAGKRIILVPGQVSDDASIRYGTSRYCNNNQQLLALARQSHPDAYIVYKPHPDVVSGLREGKIAEHSMLQLADAVVSQSPMPFCLQACDEVHTMTSLTGFEALLRGKKVVCYGQPFYSGWGLTTDLQPLARRSRKLDLETLAYGTLISYPVYAMHKASIGAQIEQVVLQINDDSALPIKSNRPFLGLLPFIKRFYK